MAVSINGAGLYSMVRVSTADSLTGWSLNALAGSGGTPSLFLSVGTIDLVREGSNAVATVVNRRRIQVLYTNSTGYDLTAGSTGTGATKTPNALPYVWANFLASGSALTQAAGGLQLTLGDGANTRFYNVGGSDTYSGDFRKWSVDPVNSPFTGSANLGDITQIGFVADVGNTTTRFDNFVVDAIDIGTGLTIDGTTDTDSLFLEAAASDEGAPDLAIGVLSEFNGIIFAQGSIAFNGTALTSVGETLVFTDTLLSAYTYGCDITGTVTFTNSAVLGSGAVNFNFNSSSATAFTMAGGSLAKFNSVTTGVGQTFDSVVFSSGNTSSIVNTITSSTFIGCGLVTLSGAGNLSLCTISNSTADSAVSTSSLDNIDDCIFIGDNTSHAVNLGTIVATTSMPWTNRFNTSTYAATDQSANATSTPGNSEVILVNVASGQTLTINVAAGATTPTYRNTGPGAVSVVAGQVSLTLTGLIAGSEVRIYTAGTATEVAGIEDSTTSFVYTYTFVPSLLVDIVVHNVQYQYLRISNVELGAADASLPIQQRFDRNYSNP